MTSLLTATRIHINYISMGFIDKTWTRWHKWSTQSEGLAVCWLYFLSNFHRHNFIDNLGVEAPCIGSLGEESPFHWLFERVGTISFIYCPEPWRLLAGVWFYDPCSTRRAGRLDQVISLVWPICFIVYSWRQLTLIDSTRGIFSHPQVTKFWGRHPW